MKVSIRFEDEATLDTSNKLIELANLIEQERQIIIRRLFFISSNSTLSH